MECSNLIKAALQLGDISKSLYQKSSYNDLIRELQLMLFELGFRKELKWDNYNADGHYGKATVAAVASFASKNNYQSDGTSVSNTLAELMLQRLDFLPDMYILWAIYKSDLRTKKYISKGSRMSISAVQVLLNTIGYGEQLNFSKFGADGYYGFSTRKAIIAYTKDNGIESDGDLLTRPVINLMLKHINAYYGRNWSDLAISNIPSGISPLELFEGSRFIGKPCLVDVQFIPMLEKINHYAEQANIYVFINQAYRPPKKIVKGAIVPPARYSNHKIGHAIDMNVRYDNGKLATSKVLEKYPLVADPVKHFLASIINDSELRWGGKFQPKDAVHIDDGLYTKDPTKWQKRYDAIHSPD